MTVQAMQVLLDWASKTNKYEQRNFAKFFEDNRPGAGMESKYDLNKQEMEKLIAEYEKENN